MYDLAQMLCAFINPTMSHKLFTKPEVTENSGFFDDLKKIDPKFDSANYDDVLDTDN